MRRYEYAVFARRMLVITLMALLWVWAHVRFPCGNRTPS